MDCLWCSAQLTKYFSQAQNTMPEIISYIISATLPPRIRVSGRPILVLYT